MFLGREEIRIAIIGLGYVGLPLALAFGRKYPTVGFDLNTKRVKELKNKKDMNREITKTDILESKDLIFCSDTDGIRNCNVYVVTVPTPIDKHCQPDLAPLEQASKMVSDYLSPNNIVIYESTVYPGAIEEVCVPILAAGSQLTYNAEFFVGYSPERINPGDEQRTLEQITKITAGSNVAAADFVDDLYRSIITVGTHKVSSIQVAEAAKVIENTQRDLNIALINELAIIFNKLNLDTQEVLNAAGTKWNFLPFKPGLVGGHCIGVDPYYLTHKAQEIGYHPEVILAGRRINDGMGRYVVSQVIKLMLEKQIQIQESKVLIMGFAFKENCTDFRNTRVIDMVYEFQEYGMDVMVYDPLVDSSRVEEEYKIKLLHELVDNKFDAIVLAVAHQAFQELDHTAIRRLGRKVHVLYDVKYMLSATEVDGRL